jgi:hypothetical protein
MRLRAIQEVWYAGRARLPGDEFDCADEDFIKILSAADLPGGQKVAKILEKTVPPALATPKVTSESLFEQQQSAEPQQSAEEDKQPARRRYYRRRDMTAGE